MSEHLKLRDIIEELIANNVPVDDWLDTQIYFDSNVVGEVECNQGFEDGLRLQPGTDFTFWADVSKESNDCDWTECRYRNGHIVLGVEACI